MRVRHLHKALWLLLLLITAQQGAVVHEISHLSAAHGVDLRAGSNGAADSTCALCPAFAQVVTPAFSHSFALPALARAALERSVELPTSAADASIPTPRSRGPPSQS
jgi:hypothetical protein